MSESTELSHRAALMTGTAIKLLLIGARDEREINVGADLLSMELGKVGQQLQSLIGKLFTNIFRCVKVSSYQRVTQYLQADVYLVYQHEERM